MQEYVGAPKGQKAENVASDDYVFKRYVNNEKKKKPRRGPAAFRRGRWIGRVGSFWLKKEKNR